ncbi:MAG: S-layer homology domain-containing protein, partial [Peptococcaceae bacterium]|nr:S-layer homology domain-containing protein [Peptococcaceae bacterium]
MRQTVRGIIFCVLGVLIIFITGTAAAAGPQNIQGEIGTSNHFVPLFADVPTSYYNAIFINYLAELELVNGYPDGNFRPFAGLTRAEAAAILVRTADEAELPTAAPFVDVNPNHWAAGSITAAAGAGLVKGYPDGTFQ